METLDGAGVKVGREEEVYMDEDEENEMNQWVTAM